MRTKIFRSPSADLIFLLDAHGQHHIREASSGNPKLAGRRCAFPLKCGQMTKTALGHLMTIGALEPSSNITEQENRWLPYTMMVHRISTRRVYPPSLPCAMPSWTIACRVWHYTAPWQPLPMCIPYTYEQGSCKLTYTYTRLLQITYQKANSTGSCHQGSEGATDLRHRNQFWALGAMANGECVEDWGRGLQHFRHSEVGGSYYALPWRDLPHRELTPKISSATRKCRRPLFNNCGVCRRASGAAPGARCLISYA